MEEEMSEKLYTFRVWMSLVVCECVWESVWSENESMYFHKFSQLCACVCCDIFVMPSMKQVAFATSFHRMDEVHVE